MIKSHNEWDTLKEVFVGRVDGAHNPDHDKDLHCINYADRDSMFGVKEGLYPQQVIQETQEDLDEFVKLHKTNKNISQHPIGVQMDIIIIVHEIVFWWLVIRLLNLLWH